MTEDLITVAYSTREQAESVITRLENIGVVSQQISLITNEQTRDGMVPPHADENVTAETAAAGAAAGGLVGTVLGALATVSAIGIPGLNVLVVGSLATTLAGLATGTVTGGLVGALVGAGISPDDAEVFERELKEGAILLSVRPMDDKQREKIKNITGESEARHLAA